MSEEISTAQPDDSIRATAYGVAIAALMKIEDLCELSCDRDVSDIYRIASDGVAEASRRSVEHAVSQVLGEPEPAGRHALVEQMGHRATVATIRETTFCGKQMIEATDLKGGGTSLISPESVYEITWLTEADALARTRPWTPVAIAAAQDDDDDDDEVAENGGVWGFTEADL